MSLRRVFIFVFSTRGLENDLSPMIISWVTRSDVVIVKSILKELSGFSLSLSLFISLLVLLSVFRSLLDLPLHAYLSWLCSRSAHSLFSQFVFFFARLLIPPFLPYPITASGFLFSVHMFFPLLLPLPYLAKCVIQKPNIRSIL